MFYFQVCLFLSRLSPNPLSVLAALYGRETRKKEEGRPKEGKVMMIRPTCACKFLAIAPTSTVMRQPVLLVHWRQKYRGREMMKCALNRCLEEDKGALNELIYTPDSNLTDTYSTLVNSRSCGLYCRSVGHAWLHRWVINTLSHCRQCGRHRQYECQRVIRVASPPHVKSWV